jgi:Ser/Thr protein kinase RdoA (MazF antagonist)
MPRIIHSVFAADGLSAELLPDYDLGNVVECRLLQHNQNDTYLVRSEQGRFILRIYQSRGSYTPRGSQIRYELDLLLYLQRRGVSVSAPVARRDGRYLRSVEAPEGRRIAVLFTYAEGEPVPHDAWDEVFCQQLGSTVGSMHAVTAGFDNGRGRFHLDQSYLLTRPLRLARPFFGHRPDDWQYVRGLAKHLASRLAALATSGLSSGICHGDIVGNTNVHVGPAGRMTLYDFECCGPGWRAYDIGVFRWALAQFKNPEQAERLLSAFLDGYQQQCALTTADLAAVPVFVAVRHFWFMGLRTGNWENWGQGEVNDRALDELIAFWRSWETQLAESV